MSEADTINPTTAALLDKEIALLREGIRLFRSDLGLLERTPKTGLNIKALPEPLVVTRDVVQNFKPAKRERLIRSSVDERWENVPIELWDHTVLMPSLTVLCRGVYLLGCGGRLVYVGKSINVHARITDHSKDQDFVNEFDDIRLIPCLFGDRRKRQELMGLNALRYDLIEHLEEAVIRWTLPQFNDKVISAPGGIDPRTETMYLLARLKISELLKEAA